MREIEAGTVFCQSCGHENRAGVRVCHECLASLPDASEVYGATPYPSAAAPPSYAAGRYEVQRLLGEGADKRVYLAHDTQLDRDVALALIKTGPLDATATARFRREARAIGRLGDHPNVVSIYDIGEEAGLPYIVVQYMAGGDVKRLLEQADDHRLPLSEALRIAEQVCLALEHAHRKGVVHRDLKPGNVWLTEEGTAKLGDFGLATVFDRSRLTVAGTMVGTVAYMPPEQALGRTADPRSDLYGLGATLYEMVTGRPPFLGDDPIAIISQHLSARPVAPSWRNPEVPQALDALILQLLAKAPEQRPESAADVRGALAAIAALGSAVGERGLPYAPNPLDRLAGGVFVGREREMEALRADLEEVISGSGRLLLLAGEPGIGKTRTAEELATYARLRGSQVLWGRCYEGEGAPAYWPWSQLISAHVRDCDAEVLRTEMGPGAADIAQVFSTVRERLPGLPAPQARGAEEERFCLFDSITTFLKNAARHQPLTLILDDLHWADRPSLLLLEFLARELQGSRLLVVGTYRDAEVRRGQPFASTLAELARTPLSRRLLLRGFSGQDVARFMELTSGLQPPAGLVEVVHRETEGNPFFVNEIVRLLATEGRLDVPPDEASWRIAIPQSVRDVIGLRLDQLSTECNRLLTVASVIGREFDLKVLARASDLSGDRLEGALEEALAARVIVEVPGTRGRYGFAHALVRETAVGEIGAMRRVRIHRRIGEILEELYAPRPEPHLAELAHHFCAAAPAGEVDKAVSYAWRAGDRALHLLAYEEGARLYETALQALEQKVPADEEQQGELLLALGEAWRRAGESERMRNTFLRAADLARRLGAPERLARAALGYHRLTGGGSVEEREIRLLEEALEALGEVESALRARVLARLAVALYHAGARERRASLSEQAVEVARRVGDLATLAYALNSRRWALWGPESIDEALAAATEILQLAEQIGDLELILEGRLWRLAALLELGDIAAVDHEIATHARLAEELRQPRYLWFSSLWKGMRALLEGRFDDAERLAEQALAIAQRMTGTEYAMRTFWGQVTIVRWEQGRLDESWVRGALERTREMPAWRCGPVNIYRDLGREAEARCEFERLAAHGFTDLPQDATWLHNLIHLADTCAGLGDVGRAAMLYELLLPYAGRNVVVGPGLSCYGSASRYLGLLAATMGRWAEAQAHFEAALRFNVKMGARPCVAHTEHDYAAMLLARDAPGDRKQALTLLDRALNTSQQLGMKPLVEKALSLKVRALGLAPDLASSIAAVATIVQHERPDLSRHRAPDGTVTILFTDIEGFTALTDRLGDQRAQEILRTHNAIVRREVAEHGGFEVKSQGDGFMLAFRSSRRGLLCTVGIQRAFADYSAQHPEEPIRVRIGVHTGEAIREADDFFGKTVILAARIAAHARGGEILVSALVRELTGSAGDFTFDDGRDVELKGISGKHRLFAVKW